ncbi:Hypothetical predicted protein, partial [Olea europaea subsp. europaea]
MLMLVLPPLRPVSRQPATLLCAQAWLRPLPRGSEAEERSGEVCAYSGRQRVSPRQPRQPVL